MYILYITFTFINDQRLNYRKMSTLKFFTKSIFMIYNIIFNGIHRNIFFNNALEINVYQ